MNKQEVYVYLTEQKISYEVMEHRAVFNMEDLDRWSFPIRSGTPRICLCGMIRSVIII